MTAFWLVLAALGAFFVLLIVRGIRFRPLPSAPVQQREITVDGEKAVNDLAAMVRCKTVSYYDEARIDEAAFGKFRALLTERFPLLSEKCTLEYIGKTGLLYRLPGKSSERPSVFMAHYDVVPADEAAWERPPFAGIIDGDVLWGRGTLDTKSTLLGVVSAAEHLLKDGFVPKNDMYFAFGGDEETTGSAQRAIVETFRARGITPAFVLDEGGAVVEGVFPGVKQPIAVIGTAEKGMMVASFTVEGAGGHASAPPARTSIGKLASAVKNVEDHPFPCCMPGPVRSMFDTLGRHSTLPYRILFANLWCLMPLLDAICKKRGGEINAMLRTTCAFTQMQGSAATNVLPTKAQVSANLRLIPGDSPESALQYLKKHTPYRDIAVKNESANPPSPCSETTGSGWEALKRTIEETWQDVLVTPYLMVACSDARHYGAISKYVYRFSGMTLSDAERGTIHGNNERIETKNIVKTVEFYVRLLAQF